MIALCDQSFCASLGIVRTKGLARSFVMCEQLRMEKPSTGELAKAAGISKSYASEILTGVRDPSRPLAIHLFRSSGWKHRVIADLSVEQIDVLESIEPWTPVSDRAA